MARRDSTLDSSRWHTSSAVTQALGSLSLFCNVTTHPTSIVAVRVKGNYTNEGYFVPENASRDDTNLWPNSQEMVATNYHVHADIRSRTGHRQIILTKVSKYNVDEAVFLTGHYCLASDKYEDGLPSLYTYPPVITHHFATVSRTMTFRSIDRFVKAAWVHFRLPHGALKDLTWEDMKPL